MDNCNRNAECIFAASYLMKRMHVVFAKISVSPFKVFFLFVLAFCFVLPCCLLWCVVCHCFFFSPPPYPVRFFFVAILWDGVGTGWDGTGWGVFVCFSLFFLVSFLYDHHHMTSHMACDVI